MQPTLQQLAERYASLPTPQNRQHTATAGIALVRAVVARTAVPTHLLAAREDLESVGMMGLLQSLDQYDPSRGTPFASFAFGRIRGALVDYLRSIDPLSREQRRRLAHAQEQHERLRQTLGDEPHEEMVADAVGMTTESYRDLVAQAQGRFALSLDATLHDDSDGSWLDLIPAEDSHMAMQNLERSSLVQYLSVIVRTLPEREQQILALYYFEDLTLREIAEMMKLTEARISQILTKTLRTLRTRLQASGNDAL